MLKIFRDNLRYLSWILWLVIIIFVAFVFVDFGGARLRGEGSGAAATVGDREVTYNEYQRQYRNLEARYRQTLGELTWRLFAHAENCGNGLHNKLWLCQRRKFNQPDAIGEHI